MKKITTFLILTICFTQNTFSQCPNLNGAMVNACGASEGSNEFVLFTTDAGTAAAVSTYTVSYGISSPPSTNTLAGSDATPKTGTGSVTATGGCTVVNVTSPATLIPAASKVMYISAALDQAYDISAYCNGGTVYVVYIKTNTNGGSSSSWTTGGTLANTPSSPNLTRSLQVTYSGSTSCSNANAPVKSYANGWASNIDGNFVTWNGTTPSYSNNGCSSIIVPLTFNTFDYENIDNTVLLKWQTSNEINTLFFYVEESIDGNNFYQIGTLNAKGFPINDYSFKVNSFKQEKLYYRVKQVDNDGKFSLSAVKLISIKNNDIKIDFKVQNPANKNNFTLKIYAAKSENAAIYIEDVLGRKLMVNKIFINQGISNLSLNINSLPGGTYTAVLITANDKKASRFVVL